MGVKIREDLNHRNSHNRTDLHNSNLKGVIIFVLSSCQSECELIVITAHL